MRSRTAITALKRTVGANVRRLRLDSDMTRTALAKKTGLHLRHLVSIEAGAQNITIGTLARLATALGCDVPALLARPKRGR